MELELQVVVSCPDVGAESQTQSLFTPRPASHLLIMRLLDLVQGSSLREKDGEEMARLTRIRTWLFAPQNRCTEAGGGAGLYFFNQCWGAGAGWPVAPWSSLPGHSSLSCFRPVRDDISKIR